MIQIYFTMSWAIVITITEFWDPLEFLFVPLFLVFSPWVLLYGPFTFYIYRGLVFDQGNLFWLLPLHTIGTVLYIRTGWHYDEFGLVQWILLLPPLIMVGWHLLLLWPTRIYPKLLTLSDWISICLR